MYFQDYYYLITDLHNLAYRESMYALKNAPVEENIMDDKVLGLNETDFFKRLLKSASAEIFKRLHRRGRGIENSYQFDADYDGNPGYVIFSFFFPDNFDANLLKPLDSLILDALVFNTLAAWFKRTRTNYLAEEFEKQSKDASDNAKSMIEMRTKVSRPSYFWGKYYVDDTVTEDVAAISSSTTPIQIDAVQDQQIFSGLSRSVYEGYDLVFYNGTYLYDGVTFLSTTSIDIGFQCNEGDKITIVRVRQV